MFVETWQGYEPLKAALGKIASEDFNEATGDFRRKFSHRLSPRIEVGLTQLVTRIKKPDGGFMYGFGCTQPLLLASLVTSLKDQLVGIRHALAAFDALTLEQLGAIQADLVE